MTTGGFRPIIRWERKCGNAGGGLVFLLLIALILFAQSARAQDIPAEKGFAGKWTANRLFHVGVESNRIALQTESNGQYTLIFSSDGTGKLDDVSWLAVETDEYRSALRSGTPVNNPGDVQRALISFVWSYDSSTGTLKLAYVGYQSSNLVRMFGPDRMILLETTGDKEAFVIVLEKNR